MKLPRNMVLLLTGLLAGCAGDAGKPPAGSVSPQPRDQAALVTQPANAATNTAMANYVDNLKKQLQLSDGQTKRITEIFRETHAQQDAVMAQRRALSKQLMEIKGRELKEINDILTPEQARQFEEMQKPQPPREIMEAAPFAKP